MIHSTQNYLKLGAWLWVLSLQYYICQLLVGLAWQGRSGFSLAHNTISDLGNTSCAAYGGRFVCSPQHTVMNASFIILGLTMAAGAYLLAKRLATGGWSYLGFGLLMLAGAGTVLVGLFPENTVGGLHALGATLPFVGGNLAMILVGITVVKLPPAVRLFSVASGVVGLIGLVLFVAGPTTILGTGGLERIAAYPQSIWMITVGLYLLRGARKTR